MVGFQISDGFNSFEDDFIDESLRQGGWNMEIDRYFRINSKI